MPFPTIITCAGSWPEPEPWMIETLFAFGASARMTRLYSGTYLMVSGLASAIPLSISGTKSLGSLTNFFTSALLAVVVGRDAPSAGPLPGEVLEHDRDPDRPGVGAADAALAGVGGPAALREHRARRICRLPGRRRGGGQRGGRVVAGGQALLEGVGGGHERVEQRLVAHVRLPALLHPLDRRAEHGDRLLAADAVGPGHGAARPQERRAPDRPRGAADTAGDDDGDLPQERGDVRAVEPVPVGQDDLEPARERVAEVAVADDRVELAEVGLVVDRRLGHRAYDQLDLVEACLRHHASSGRASGTTSSSRHASRSSSLTQSPGAALERFASTRVASPPGSPNELTTSAASVKSSSSV